MLDTFSIHTILELEFEIWEKNWYGQLRDSLNEGLAHADALTTKEGAEAGSVPALALRSEEVWTLCVEALRDIFVRLLPFLGVVGHPSHVDDEHIALSDAKIASFDVLTDPDSRGEIGWWHHAQRLIEAICVKWKVGIVLIID